MKSILILIASVFICVVHSLPPVPLFALNKVNDHWSEFKKTHNKTYRNSTHEAQKYISNKKIFYFIIYNLKYNLKENNYLQIHYKK